MITFPFFLCLTNARIKIPALTTTTIGSVCPKCGTSGKSGEISCCARGGSWFKNCGGAGNAKLHHTWYEGIQSCKTRSQSNTVIGNELNGAQQKDTYSSEGAGMASYKAVLAATRTFVFASVNTSTPMSDTTSSVTSNASMIYSTHTSAIKAITTQGCANILTMTIHIYIFL